MLFVPGALPGERCLVCVVNIGKTAAHGKLLRVEAASPHRIEPDCPYFPACGGCVWVLADGFYDDTVGLIRDQKKQGFMEV